MLGSSLYNWPFKSSHEADAAHSENEFDAPGVERHPPFLLRASFFPSCLKSEWVSEMLDQHFCICKKNVRSSRTTCEWIIINRGWRSEQSRLVFFSFSAEQDAAGGSESRALW